MSKVLMRVAKKAIPKATDRNRLKRVIREAIRELSLKHEVVVSVWKKKNETK